MVEKHSNKNFTPIPKRMVPEAVAKQIQEFIATNKLLAGSKLPTERELALMLEVSRSGLREGIKLLAAVDIVETRQGSGTYVKHPQSMVLLDPAHLSSDEQKAMLVKAHMARKIIDCAVAEIAAQKITDQELIELQEYLEESETDDYRTRLAHTIDLTFEAMLGASTKNEYICALQNEAHRNFQRAWESTGFMPRSADERNEQHWRIFEALKERNSKLAREKMKEHFNLSTITKMESQSN